MSPSRLPSVAEKVAFLSRPDSYPHRPADVAVKETHMSWVFIAGKFVYKLKKPVAYPFLDFMTLEARRLNCLEEVRLNSRLAEHVYLGVVPLFASPAAELSLGSGGEVVEWLVHMKTLPAMLMLDELIAAGHADRPLLQRAADRLTCFYRNLPPVEVSADWVLARFLAEHEEDARLLSDNRFSLESEKTRTVLQAMSSALRAIRPCIEARAAAKVYIEGHGDLRPEHVCLLSEPVFIDCLEFNRDLRILDPFDEIAYLGVECERLGAPWIGDIFLHAARSKLLPPATDALICFYRASRALLRARLALAHLTEANPRSPEKWEPKAREYVRLAELALRRLETEIART